MSTIKQNYSAKKIQHFYKVFKYNEVIKNVRKLELKALAESISFNEFTRILRNKNNIEKIDNFLKIISLKNKFNGRIILTGYLINYYADELLDKKDERHPIDKSILEWSNKLVDLIENNDVSNYVELKKNVLFFTNYINVFNQWKEMDKNRTIERIIISYKNRSEHIDIINKDDSIDPEQKKMMLGELNKQKEKLEYDILLINREFDIDYLRENYQKMYDEMKKSYEKIFVDTTNTMKKAYFDMVSQELKSGNSKPVYDLFLEISKRIINITPEKRKDSLIEKMNGDNINDFLIYGDWNEDLIKHIKFLGDIIVMFDAPINDKENLEWKESLNYLNKHQYHEKLPIVLIEMEEKLDKIYSYIYQLNKNTKK